MTPRTSLTGHTARDAQTSSATGGVTISNTASGLPKRDFTEFIWGKLNDIDGHLTDLAEKHGRLDEKLSNVSSTIDSKTEPIQKAVEKLDGKVSKLETSIRWATAIVVATAAIASCAMTVYKMVEHHLTINWH